MLNPSYEFDNQTLMHMARAVVKRRHHRYVEEISYNNQVITMDSNGIAAPLNTAQDNKKQKLISALNSAGTKIEEASGAHSAAAVFFYMSAAFFFIAATAAITLVAIANPLALTAIGVAVFNGALLGLSLYSERTTNTNLTSAQMEFGMAAVRLDAAVRGIASAKVQQSGEHEFYVKMNHGGTLVSRFILNSESPAQPLEK